MRHHHSVYFRKAYEMKARSWAGEGVRGGELEADYVGDVRGGAGVEAGAGRDASFQRSTVS